MPKTDTRKWVAQIRRIEAQVLERLSEERLQRLAGPEPPPEDDRERFRRLARRVFGLGLSPWIVVRKWPATLEALHDADPHRVAALSVEEMARFLSRPDVIRNGAKLAAVRHNAGVVAALTGVYSDLRAYARAVSSEGEHVLLADLRTRLRLVGPVSAARIAQEFGVDVMVPHPSVVRLFVRLGWLGDGRDAEAFQALAANLARRTKQPGPFPRGRLGAVLLAFATGRWSVAAICGRTPACGSCPVRRTCPRCGVEEEAA